MMKSMILLINIKNRLEYSLYKKNSYIMNGEEIEEIEDDWIEEYANPGTDIHSYSDTYAIKNITIQLLYINIEGVIDTQIKYKYIAKNNMITREELHRIVSENNISNDKKYRLYFLASFNICNDADRDTETERDTDNYFKRYTSIEDIIFKENGIYGETDTLYLIYHEKPKQETYIPSLKIPYYSDKHLRKTRSKEGTSNKNRKIRTNNKTK